MDRLNTREDDAGTPGVLKSGMDLARHFIARFRRMMSPENMPISAPAREIGITEQTLYAWRPQAKERDAAVPGDGKNAEMWSAEDEYAVTLEAVALDNLRKYRAHHTSEGAKRATSIHLDACPMTLTHSVAVVLVASAIAMLTTVRLTKHVRGD